MYVLTDEFIDTVKHTTVYDHIPFDFETAFMQLHFGCKRRRHVNYAEFTQLLHVSVFIGLRQLSQCGLLNYFLTFSK